MHRKTLPKAVLSLFTLFAFYTLPVMAAEPADALNQAASMSISPSGEKIWQSLGLSGDQTDRINGIRVRYNQLAAQLQGQIRSKQAELEQQLLAPASNPMRLRQLMDERLALQNVLQKASLDCFIAMKQELTDAQRVALQRHLIAFRKRGVQ